MPLELDPNFTGFLSSKIETAQVMLFTGAGFSMDCKDLDGSRLPSADKLTSELWGLVYEAEPYDSDTTLQDIYGLALARKRSKLTEMLRRRLSVDAASIPDYYAQILSVPWKKIYTVNIDDLCNSAQRRFDLPVSFRVISGTSGRIDTTGTGSKPTVDVIHLNGTIEDIPEAATFSRMQYSERLASQEPAYHQLVADLSSHPFIFIGTKLDEPILWQHISLRGIRGGKQFKELRPRSFLVTPGLGKAKQGLLETYNCEWRKGYTEDLASLLGLPGFASAAKTGLSAHSSRARSGAQAIPDVGTLLATTKKREPSRFLSGDEPSWSDIALGVAAQRDSDEAVFSLSTRLLQTRTPPEALIITGTAGAGKTTTAMRLAASLSATHRNCYWLGADEDCAPYQFRKMASALPSESILFLDDADRFGSELSAIARDLMSEGKLSQLVFVMRSHRIERSIQRARMNREATEFTIPQLADSDIKELLKTLDKYNMLGQLKGKSEDARFRVLSDLAGRQLLVAMIEATSGRRFEEKLIEEWESLSGPEEQSIYAMLAICHSLKFALSRDELLFAAGEGSSSSRNEVLNALDKLTSRNLIAKNDVANTYRSRHRFLADILCSELATRQLASPLIGDLAFVLATKVTVSTPGNDSHNRFLRRLINHDFLGRMGTVEQARLVYERIESLCAWNHHYLLQRGSLEVEVGNLRLADNYLSQARSLQPENHLVATEYAYMRLKRAYEEPQAATASSHAEEAIQILREQIRLRGLTDEHPYHVLGSQGLAWSRRGIKDTQARAKLVGELEMLLKQAVSVHTNSEGLKTLLRDLQTERLRIGSGA